MKNTDQPKSLSSVLDTLKKFEKKHAGGNINYKSFQDFESIYWVACDLWLDGYLQKTDSPDNDMHQVTLLHDEAVAMRKKMIANLQPADLEAAAENGDTEAAWLLVHRHEEALGVSKAWLNEREKKVFEWGEIAIQGCEEKGLSWRKWDLARKYIETRNFDRAIELLIEASKEGEMQANYMLGCLYCEGEIETNGELAKHYLELAVAAEDERAMVMLARLYLSDDLIEEDLRQTFELSRKAKMAGSEEGKELLAHCFEFGWGTRQNRPKAFRLYQELGVNYSDNTRRQIAEDYLQGISVEKDITKALHILNEAADDGDAEALTSLATKYAYGFDVAQDETLAFQYAMRASKLDDTPVRALLLLGSSYVLGRGTETDHKKAAYWLELARERATTDMERAEAEVWLEDELGLTILRK